MSQLTREELRHFRPDRPTALTIGNFDGVHLGHQHLIRFVIERARALGLAAGAVTLYPDPMRVLRPDAPFQYLTSLEERLELLRGLGLDLVAPVTFTSELAELSPRAFVELLREELDLRLLIMGPDNAFGRNREATPEAVAKLGAELGFEVAVLPAPLASGEAAVSATSIRAALAAGDLDSVSRQLGRPYSLRGPVVAGFRRGRDLGFPTANVAVTPDRALPAFGVYATWAYVGEERHASATNIGVRPQFDGDKPSVETYIFDFDGDLYDQTLRIEIVARLRPEAKFDTLDALIVQMNRDVEQARRILATAS
ncbi:MAG TPA: bifunctional riboflavin kinase/FAD synthetase [Dehalococcoidia bacterium]|nr:bifunctional riboflavin kinase/FAD synthetase [Dehalococcoidia bacterium]